MITIKADVKKKVTRLNQPMQPLKLNSETSEFSNDNLNWFSVTSPSVSSTRPSLLLLPHFCYLFLLSPSFHSPTSLHNRFEDRTSIEFPGSNPLTDIAVD